MSVCEFTWNAPLILVIFWFLWSFKIIESLLDNSNTSILFVNAKVNFLSYLSKSII